MRSVSDPPWTNGRARPSFVPIAAAILGVCAFAGVAFGFHKDREAKKQTAYAEEAERTANAYAESANEAWVHAQQRAAEAEEAQRAAQAKDAEAKLYQQRARKLAADLTNQIHKEIASQGFHDPPKLRFEGAYAASTNGEEICVNIEWVLSGIVDTSSRLDAIWGRVFGVVAHEWFHYLDTQRGQREYHKEELLADAYAGRQLADHGVSPQPFAELLRMFPQSSRHPPGNVRAEVMLDEYNKRVAKT